MSVNDSEVFQERLADDISKEMVSMLAPQEQDRPIHGVDGIVEVADMMKDNDNAFASKVQ